MLKNLESLGYSRWFQSRVDFEKLAEHDLARVVSVHKDSYTVTKGEAEIFAELSGHLFYTADSAADLPTVGDWVYTDFYDDNSHAIIHGIVPRKTLLKRKAAGKAVDFQLIAANIDIAFIIQSLDYNFNLNRMERYLVMVNNGGITPVILLSKCDLIGLHEMEKIKKSVFRIAPQTRLLAFSNVSGENLDAIKDLLSPGRTYCLLGSSGVGKTTLLNSLLGGEYFATQTVSKKENKGRHTTTSRELMLLANGAMIIDTPGMRELGNLSVDSGLDETFSEIQELARQCRFSNCSHTNEKGCAVLAAISAGELSEQRFENYTKMRNEAAYHEMSYYEKRVKEKEFGKLVKATMKHKKDKYA